MTTTHNRCPRCGEPFTGYPALSRWDNRTSICSDCGTSEALMQFSLASQTDPRGCLNPVTGEQPWVQWPVR